MMYKYMKLEDKTEIVHSEKRPDGSVKVYIEKPNATDGFHHMTCTLPDFRVEEVFGFSQSEVEEYLKLIKAESGRIIEAATSQA